MDTEPDASDAKVIADLALKSANEIVHVTLDEPIEGLPEKIPLLVNKQTGALTSLRDLFERHRTRPERKTGTAKATTLESFIALTERHKTEDSVIFADADWKKPSLTAVIDYHEDAHGGDAAHGKHRIHYSFPLSEEWSAWIGRDGKPMSQADFAEWIEDHITELATPTEAEAEKCLAQFGFKTAAPNELQALSRGLQVRVETRVKSNVVLQTGEGVIAWEEDHKDNLGNKFVIPGLFILSIAPFFLGDPCRIPVRLRYRVRDGVTSWHFHIYRPDIFITEQVRRDLDLAASTLGLPAYQGTPEMSA